MISRLGTAVLLGGTASLSLVLAYAAAVWLAPWLADGQALIAWSGLMAALGAAVPWMPLWLTVLRRDQRPPSDPESVSG